MVTGLKHAIAFVLNRKIIINSNTPNLVAQRDPFCLQKRTLTVQKVSLCSWAYSIVVHTIDCN